MIIPELDPVSEALNIEVGLWNVEKSLRGKVESLEEMSQRILSFPKYAVADMEVYLKQHRQRKILIEPYYLAHRINGAEKIAALDGNVSKGYDIYSLRKKGRNSWILNVGYGCGECRALMIGPPYIFKKLAEEVVYFCDNCNIEIDRFNLERGFKSELDREHEGIQLNLDRPLLQRHINF